ncbi:uncharacterized protein FOMMEDRAFT_146816 [Fomitiporia mediterranea MF3/22]|uniref:uncharacterized protein n=1 Tax=Fomitiporia mediterranea (strain MF3/22) TaxID=694068 RepID=UPI0004407DBF|nr:uncharacterized protein FOMMEDRAFT_146816 [Fomitiporia mediterranea MF3/22]EJD03141.1 hypothetical protein FOMMEDRAFT_146816 [Fomitiporia mediterranea MF3/22]
MALKDKDSSELATPISTQSNSSVGHNVLEPEQNGVEPEADLTAVVPDTGEASDGGKLKMIVQLLKRCLGVKDLAAMRLSLPASLLEPVPNLEYWQYLDRPDLFVSINDSDDPLERMLAVIRFTFTKDLKFIRGKVVKPYNSVLGEHFRAHWDVLPVEYPPDPLQAPVHRQHTTSPVPSADPSAVFGKGPKDESTLSFRSSKSAGSAKNKKRASSIFDFATARVTPLPKSPGPSSPDVTPTVNGTVESNLAAGVSNLSLGNASGSYDSGMSGDADDSERVRVAFLTEQVSHHPPISTYYATCPTRGVSLMGIDQISARVSGTGVRVAPGALNKGIFMRIDSGPGTGEQYQVTHPTAMVNGLLRGSFYVTVGESTIITCTGIGGEEKGKERLRAVIEYKEEPWLGTPKFAVEGVIHTYREGDEDYKDWIKVKHVPRSATKVYFDGSWRSRVRWRRADASADEEQATLIDVSTLLVVPKRVRPLEKQHTYESRKLWQNVTSNLLAKEYSEATRHKHAIEQRQRDKAAERKKKGEEFIPAFFEKDIDSGIPVLTAEGQRVLEEELKTVDGET